VYKTRKYKKREGRKRKEYKWNKQIKNVKKRKQGREK